MVAGPVAFPETIPVDPMEAYTGALLLQIPPGMVSESVTKLFTHTAFGPVMASGYGLTVTTKVTGVHVAVV